LEPFKLPHPADQKVTVVITQQRGSGVLQSPPGGPLPKDMIAGKPRPMGKRSAFVSDHVAGAPDGNKRPVTPSGPGRAKLGRLSRGSPT
jgi:hypothetical protein